MRMISYKFIMAATAVLAVGTLAVSCSKEPVVGNNGDGDADGVRTISVSFKGGTKTVLGEKESTGNIPARFKADDVILVSNGKSLEDCKVVIDGSGNASFTTTLQGTLDAVYPPEAAAYIGYGITGFKVSDSQSGRFADAHICTATIAADAVSATFKNETAILKFYVDESIGVTSIKITSAGADIATGSKTITVVAPSGQTLADVTDDPQKRICYVAVLPGVNADQLTFKTEATTQPTLPKTPADDAELTAGKLYKAFIPYYITIGIQKWGYCNVGAFLPEEVGKYFVWGETAGQTISGGAFTFPVAKYYTADNSTWDSSKGFSWENCPYTDGVYNTSSHDVFTKYTNDDSYAKSGTADNKTVLDLADDVAYVNWGDSWSMPIGGTGYADDFSVLATACNSICSPSTGTFSYTDTVTVVPTTKGVYFYDVDGSRGAYFIDENDNKLFFPVTGNGSGTSAKATSDGNYWLSTLNLSDSQIAYYMAFSKKDFNPDYSGSRFYGKPVRPILKTPISGTMLIDMEFGGTY